MMRQPCAGVGRQSIRAVFERDPSQVIHSTAANSLHAIRLRAGPSRPNDAIKLRMCKTDRGSGRRRGGLTGVEKRCGGRGRLRSSGRRERE
eukprot:1043800-Rhodomonas_salina.1